MHLKNADIPKKSFSVPHNTNLFQVRIFIGHFLLKQRDKMISLRIIGTCQVSHPSHKLVIVQCTPLNPLMPTG